MLVIGLTGSIGMGKSTIAARFRQLGIGVCDADAEVHKLYEGKAVPAIEAAFPGTTHRLPGGGGEVDRAALARALMTDTAGFKILERIVHPMVFQAEKVLLREAKAAGAEMAVLEIPLLFEGGGEKRVDVTVVVSAPAEVQRQRVLAREGMTAAKLAAILARQLGDAEQRRRADFIVDTSGSLETTAGQVADIVSQLRGRHGSAFERHWRCT